MTKEKFPQMEENLLKYWQEKEIFAKSLAQRKNAPLFSFYDGPPFASGLPHYGHILASVIKDSVTRYFTMKGYKVERTVGWDCHGLPVENLVEKQLKIKSKKEIEVLAETKEKSIEKFNQACKDSVFLCLDEWMKTLHRIGRWADYSQQYATYKDEYIESVWWAFKQLYDKNLIYKDFRATPYCPRCGTPISNFEVNQGYKEVEDQSVYIKFKSKKDSNVYFLVWTTTPWTLPANLFLAVGEKVDYVKVKLNGENLILAEARLQTLEGDYQIIEKFKGKKLIGQEYEPLYAWKDHQYRVVEGDDFVSIKDGTGIVHIAPAFGEIDNEVGKKEKIKDFPINVDLEGKIIIGLNLPGEGKFVKKADEDIKTDLKNKNLLYKEEKITHTYPFCWRCDSPLLYYPLESWYVKVTAIKDKLIKNNLSKKLKQADGETKKGIHWTPNHLKEGRFGKWLEGVKDWDISRSRYWGAPIPLWQCEKCKEIKVISSIDEIREKIGNYNKLFLIRHGEAENNVKKIINSLPEIDKYHLTKKGIDQVENLAEILKKEKIDIIFSSPLLRTKETAEIIAKSLGLKIIFDERLKEVKAGEFNGKSYDEFEKQYPTRESRSEDVDFGVESGEKVRERSEDFLREIKKKYKNKNIVIVSHADPLQIFYGITKEFTLLDSLKAWYPHKGSIKIAYSEPVELHRPYIDQVVFDCVCGGKMKRIEGVFDCWFESGSMPFAQYHYPYENKEKFEAGFPADFIAEGLDQTRGWFYTLHVLATAIFDEPAFKNVIVNGLILAPDGKKLSKRFKNYTPIEEIFDKYGVDSLRYFLLSSVPMGEDCRFADESIGEVLRKVIIILWNVYSFYDMYGKKETRDDIVSDNILDRWIIAKLNLLIKEMTQSLDAYDLNKATRLSADFVDKLSTWYLRRSRGRFKDDEESEAVSATLRDVLLTLTKLLAPFAIFISDEIYQKISKDKESVHLENWPVYNEKLIDRNLLDSMEVIREIVELGLAARSEGKMKVRQPLKKLKIENFKFQIDKSISDLIKDELNIKEVVLVEEIKEEENLIIKDNGRIKVGLDLKLTPELKQEGQIRELTRQINSFRKELKMTVNDAVNIYFETENKDLEKAIEKYSAQIIKSVGASMIKAEAKEIPCAKEINIEGDKVLIKIEKI